MTSSSSPPAPAPSDEAVGRLASQLTEQVSRLVRDELALAKVETTSRAKKLGVGAGAFGGTAVLALYAVGALIAAAILGLATVLDAWLAALIVGLVLLLVAGLLALVGKSNVSKGSPPVPTDTIHSVQADVDAVREAVKR